MGDMVDTKDMVDTVAREKLKLLQKLMPKLGVPLDTDTVPDMVLADVEATVLVLPAMEVTVLDTVSGRDLLMPKPGAPLDTDTVPDMVLVDMEVTVLALPAMEVTVLDTVSGRDLLMPGTEVTTVDTEDTDMVDTDTESKFHTSINLLPFILILVIIPAETMHYSIPSTKENQIIFRHVSSKVEEEFRN